MVTVELRCRVGRSVEGGLLIVMVKVGGSDLQIIDLEAGLSDVKAIRANLEAQAAKAAAAAAAAGTMPSRCNRCPGPFSRVPRCALSVCRAAGRLRGFFFLFVEWWCRGWPTARPRHQACHLRQGRQQQQAEAAQVVTGGGRGGGGPLLLVLGGGG